MKKKKITLGQLEVKSFVTSMEDDISQTIAGGAKHTRKNLCTASGVCVCQSEDCDYTEEIVCTASGVCVCGTDDPFLPIIPF